MQKKENTHTESRNEQPKPPFAVKKQNHPGLESRVEPTPKFQAEKYLVAEILKVKKALITGGDSGIGRAVTYFFAREGADVAITFLPEEQSDAEFTKDCIEKEGRICILILADLKDAAFYQQAVDSTAKELGGLNILVSNAVQQMRKHNIEDISFEEWDLTFKTKGSDCGHWRQD
ncbi:MAG: SDR family NAD(P)-dependent oxidoreductase [Bdellovibrionales bacterium]|nr:SDR family NAD(P)-dependent oxidoreductase [Bdellovibrionales bacterium]